MESFFLSLSAITLAELGDKTQLIVIYLSARFRRPAAVLSGLVVGAALNAGLAVAGGALLQRLLGPAVLEWIVAAGFIAIGLWILLRAEDEDDDEAAAASSRHGAFLTTLALFFVMEMGDKTQLATVALAAGLPEPRLVFAGATLGLIAANLPALWLGHRYASRIPRRLLNRLSGALFVLIGIVLAGWRLV